MMPHVRSMLLVLCLPVLAAPRASLAQYKIYWGEVHGHTNISDGKGTLDDYFTHARDVARLDFALVTDHDFGNGGIWRMPKANWALTQEKVDEYTVKGKFVAIAGYEWTSQPKYWTPEEPIFTGPIKYYNHKNVFFASRVDYIFSAKDLAYNSPRLLAEAVRKHGGLIHNNHPDANTEGRDQFDYGPSCYPVIVNTEMRADIHYYNDGTYHLLWETVARGFLNTGGKTGFVGGSDTHEGEPAARTAVLAGELTRPAIFDAFRHRRCYAVSNARIIVDFQINKHPMGEEIEIEGKAVISVRVKGTDTIREVAIVRNGFIVHSVNPNADTVQLEYEDGCSEPRAWYYLRVTQADVDANGNPSRAWSSPIWVTRKQPAPDGGRTQR
jgi:hypothetical protein